MRSVNQTSRKILDNPSQGHTFTGRDATGHCVNCGRDQGCNCNAWVDDEQDRIDMEMFQRAKSLGMTLDRYLALTEEEADDLPSWTEAEDEEARLASEGKG